MQQTALQQFIYVLRCVENKIYVGLTTCASKRIKEHREGNGAEWTRKYPPLPEKESKPEVRWAENELDEDFTTLRLMFIYGVENVRGGSLCNIKLHPAQVRVLRGLFRNARKECFACGKPGHFKQNCPEYAASVSKYLKKIREQAQAVRDCVRKHQLTLPPIERPLHPLHFSSTTSSSSSLSKTIISDEEELDRAS